MLCLMTFYVNVVLLDSLKVLVFYFIFKIVDCKSLSCQASLNDPIE